MVLSKHCYRILLKYLKFLCQLDEIQYSVSKHQNTVSKNRPLIYQLCLQTCVVP